MREIGIYYLIIFILFVASLLIIAIGVKTIKSGKKQYKGITEAVIKKVDTRYVSKYEKWKNYIEYIYYINGVEYIAYEDVREITEVIHQDSKIEIHYDLNNPKKSYYNEQQVVYEKKIVATFLILLGGMLAFCTFVELLPWVIYPLLKQIYEPCAYVETMVNTGIGCYLYFSPLSKLPVQTVAVCGYLEPLSAVVFAALLLNEKMTLIQIVGAACIIGEHGFLF